jgi:hypothetical protein
VGAEPSPFRAGSRQPLVFIVNCKVFTKDKCFQMQSNSVVWTHHTTAYIPLYTELFNVMGSDSSCLVI